MKAQRAYFPVDVLNLTQGYGSKSSSHKYSYALDLGGKRDVYAPFDCKVSKIFVKKGCSYEVWLTSLEKVMCVNGYYGYLTISFTHPKDIDKLKKNQTFKQGEKVCSTNKMTGVNSGPHLHLELSKGKKAGWVTYKKNGVTHYINVNKIKPEDYLFVKEDAVIKNDVYKNVDYNFLKESDITYKVVSEDGLNMRTSPEIKKGNIIKVLKYGAELIRFKSSKGWSYMYNYGDFGYVFDKYIKKK